MDIHVFFNPASAAGRSAMVLGATLATLRTLGADVSLHRPASASEARREMQELAGHAERIVVVGGDGMVHHAANALAGSTTVCGIIAAGTGNDAAKSLGLPHDTEAACKAALGEPTAIDVIESAAGVAVTVATAGFSADVNDRANDMQRIKSGAKYTLAALLELPRIEAHAMAMTLDGVEHQIEANLIAVANTKFFGGGMKIAPDAELANGMLDVVVIGPAPRVAFASLLPTVFSGRHVKSKYVTVHRASKIELGGTLPVRADGEDFGQLPATYTVRPSSLLVAGARPQP